MKLHLFVLTITSVVLTSIANAGEKWLTISEWLQLKHAQLAKVENPAKIKSVVLDQSDKPNKDGLYHMYPKKGYLKFADGSWVLLTSHSVHADDGLDDITLIRTSSGEYYFNRGHCCLPILLSSSKKVETLEDFLKTHGKGGQGKLTLWQKYNNEGAADQDATTLESKSKSTEKPQLESKTRPQ